MTAALLDSNLQAPDSTLESTHDSPAGDTVLDDRFEIGHTGDTMLTMIFTNAEAERNVRMAWSCQDWSVVGHRYPASQSSQEALE